MNNFPYKTFDEARLKELILSELFDEGATTEQVILTLVNQKALLVEQLIRLESITPRRYQLPDGKVYVWHCPDDLVPIRPLGQ